MARLLLSLLLYVPASLAANPVATGSVRSDIWNPDLKESGVKDPVDGRRVHVIVDQVSWGGASFAAKDAATSLSSVKINGQEGLGLSFDPDADLTYFDWLRAHGNANTSTLWISFHTRNPQWLGNSVDVSAVTKSGSTLFNGTVDLTPAEGTLTLSYLTFRKGGTEAVFHLHNNDEKNSVAVDKLTLNGDEVSNVPSHSIPANGHSTFAAAVPYKVSSNDVWTTTITTAGKRIGFGGRVGAVERFVVEAWPHSGDCPLPGANDGNAAEVLEIGIDSVFLQRNKFEKDCGSNLVDIVNALPSKGPSSQQLHVVTGPDTASMVTPAAREAAIDAILLGDECDGDIDAKHIRSTFQKAAISAQVAPTVPTYVGSKTLRNIGTFAGLADIQGSDAYFAACAPTMSPAVVKLPFGYPYFYLKNARDNHAPGVFWGYSQLYSDAWSYQANANELIAQMGMVVLSGSKAMMFFQSHHDDFGKHKIKTISKLLKSIKAVGDVIREGDIGGLNFELSDKPQALVEVIRSPEKVLVTVINTNAGGYSNLLCHVGITNKHWTFHKQTLDSITLKWNQEIVGGLSNWQEAVDGELVPLSGVKISGDATKQQDVVLSNVELDDQVPVRLFLADVKP